MASIRDFEDMLFLLNQHEVRYLIIGGLAFIYHAKPRYTKDMDIWVEPSPENLSKANQALSEFGSPMLLSPGESSEILQIGVAPNRIDLIRNVEGAVFSAAWEKRITDGYGDVPANWVDLDTLIAIKERIAHPRHQEDVRVLREVKRLREEARR